MAQLSGSSNPTNRTKGQVGDIYTNTTTGIKFKCELAYESDDSKYIYYQWLPTNSSSSSSIMYIHVTSEEKDGETVFKSDKTYEEIREAIDFGKSPVVIYNNVLFNLDICAPGESYIFINNRMGIIGIIIDPDNDNTTTAMGVAIPPYVIVTWSVNNMDIDVRIRDNTLSKLPIDMERYIEACQLVGKNPVIRLFVEKTNGIDLSYNVFLYLTGDGFAGTTFINGNLTYCRLTMEIMTDTSTWDYTETEMPVNTTDEHINTLIDKKLGVIENGTY